MANIRKQKRNKKFNYTKDRKRSWKNKKKLPKIKCNAIQNAWDEKKSVEQNMEEMGLASDSNKTVRIPKAKEFLTESFESVMRKAKKQKKSTKQFVAESLEMEAQTPKESRLSLSEPEVKHCIYLLEKYGEDYKAMAKDPKNHYQDTPKQIRKKINKFKKTTEQYQTYLRMKGEGTAAMDTT